MIKKISVILYPVIDYAEQLFRVSDYTLRYLSAA